MKKLLSDARMDNDPVYDRVLQRSHIRRPNQNVRRVRLRNRSQWALILDIVDKTDCQILADLAAKVSEAVQPAEVGDFSFPRISKAVRYRKP